VQCLGGIPIKLTWLEAAEVRNTRSPAEKSVGLPPTSARIQSLSVDRRGPVIDSNSRRVIPFPKFGRPPIEKSTRMSKDCQDVSLKS
jgi:hypothetical protein